MGNEQAAICCSNHRSRDGGNGDKLDFHLQYDEKNIGDIKCHSGNKAREELKRCLAGKPFYDKNPLKDKNIK